MFKMLKPYININRNYNVYQKCRLNQTLFYFMHSCL